MMNIMERETNDYRSVCKRCFVYVKENIGEKIPEELVDYTKGAKLIILEEFIKSLSRLPEVYTILAA